MGEKEVGECGGGGSRRNFEWLYSDDQSIAFTGSGMIYFIQLRSNAA